MENHGQHLRSLLSTHFRSSDFFNHSVNQVLREEKKFRNKNKMFEIRLERNFYEAIFV